MERTARIAAALMSVMVYAAPPAAAQSFVLDPMSASLPAVPATAGDILIPQGPPPALPPPVVGISAARLGLLPGDVIDAISFRDDAGPGATLYFSVSRSSVGLGVAAPPDVSGENVAFVPLGIQPEAASDIFVAADPACGLAPGFHSQILDGNGALIGPPSLCGYGGGAPFGLGLSELLPLPPPPFDDDVTAFDLGLPGRAELFCVAFSLAPGSPTLVPGANPRLPFGAEPGDVLGWCPDPSRLGIFASAGALGLVSGGPGCAPPVCDDIDALSGSSAPFFSLTPTSPSVTGPPFLSPADILAAGPAVVLAAGALGLAATDDVDAIDFAANPCPVAPGGDVPDFDGVGLCDNCPAAFNPGQEDSDGDGVGDVCDPCTDTDGDGFGNSGFPANLCPTDVCPRVADPQTDTDGDGIGDACDLCPTTFDPTNTDSDGDFVPDACDNCPAFGNPMQSNTDGDAAGDDCDPCPLVAGAAPAPLTAVKKILLNYGGSGPGHGDDKPKVIGAKFSSAAAFNPATSDDVHVTLVNTTTGGTVFSADLTQASAFWSQHSGQKNWKYKDPLPTPLVGVKVAKLKESPTGSGNFQFKMVGKLTNIAGPLAPADDLQLRLEIETAGTGVCFNSTLASCTNKPSKDICQP